MVFPALLPLTYITDLLSRSKSLFLALFQPYLQALVLSLSSSSSGTVSTKNKAGANGSGGDEVLSRLNEQLREQRWEEVWERCLRGCEERADNKKGGGKSKKPTTNGHKATSNQKLQTQSEDLPRTPEKEEKAPSPEEIAKNVQALKTRLKSSSGRSSPAPGSGTNSPNSKARPGNGRRGTSNLNSNAEKVMRKWGNDTGNGEVDLDAMQALDFSAPPPPPEEMRSGASVDVDGLVDKASLGQVGREGFYEVADWGAAGKGELPSEEEILARGRRENGNQGDSSNVLSSDVDGKEISTPAPTSRLAGLFDRLTGKKVLTAQDLDPVLREMEKHLMSKNVALDIAEKLCEGVGKALVGKKLGGMTSVKSEVEAALEKVITQVLSPKTSTDILLDIKRKASLPLPPSVDGTAPRKDPYTMTFIGVNGVGKSTNLSKVAFWLLQNKLRVLIAACDTFRSGAVEQLRQHVRNLGALEGQLGLTVEKEGEGGKSIELFERGYGKDAAGIARDAISYGELFEIGWKRQQKSDGSTTMQPRNTNSTSSSSIRLAGCRTMNR